MHEMLGNKGQANNAIVAAMILILVVSVVGIVGITVYNSIDSSLGSDLTGTSLATKNNFTNNTYEGYVLAGNIPIILAAGLLITVILGFALFTRG